MWRRFGGNIDFDSAFDGTKRGFILPGLPHKFPDVADIKVGQRIPAGRCWWLAWQRLIGWIGCGGLTIDVDLTVCPGADVGRDVRKVGCFRRDIRRRCVLTIDGHAETAAMTVIKIVIKIGIRSGSNQHVQVACHVTRWR